MCDGPRRSRRASGSIAAMYRRHLIVALVAGCGSVKGPTPTPDATPDAPATVHLMEGCIYKAAMDETAWPATGKPVLDSCGMDSGALSGTGAAPTHDATRGQVGSFSNNACIDIANAADLHAMGALTMSAWVQPINLDGTTSNGILSKRVDKGMASEYGLFIWTHNHVWIDLGDERYEGAFVMSDNKWTQITAIFDGSKTDPDRVRLFINGSRDQVAHDTTGTLGTTLPNTTAPLHLGCTPAPSAGTQQTFQGLLDDVTIWNRALDDDEIAFLAK